MGAGGRRAGASGTYEQASERSRGRVWFPAARDIVVSSTIAAAPRKAPTPPWAGWRGLARAGAGGRVRNASAASLQSERATTQVLGPSERWSGIESPAPSIQLSTSMWRPRARARPHRICSPCKNSDSFLDWRKTYGATSIQYFSEHSFLLLQPQLLNGIGHILQPRPFYALYLVGDNGWAIVSSPLEVWAWAGAVSETPRVQGADITVGLVCPTGRGRPYTAAGGRG